MESYADFSKIIKYIIERKYMYNDFTNIIFNHYSR